MHFTFLCKKNIIVENGEIKYVKELKMSIRVY